MFELSCLKCGNNLHSGRDLTSPKDALKFSGYVCPKCGTRLSTDSFELEIQTPEGRISRVESPPRHLRTPAVAPRPAEARAQPPRTQRVLPSLEATA
ncbi:MAG: hypothetical protein ABSF83_15215 [Nitrososphaerales archaeon]